MYCNKITGKEKLSDLLMILLYSSFTILSNDVSGIYTMIVLIGMIFVIYITSVNKIKLHWGTFNWYILLFCLFSLLSSFWSIRPDYAIEKGVTLLSILICYTLLYAAYYKADISRLLNIIMWSGVLLSIYSIFFYGLDFLDNTLKDGGRLDNSFANVNVIGMACAMSILLAYYYFKTSKKYFYLLLCIPTLLMVAGSGSRKALMIVIIGIVVVSIFVSNSSRKLNRLLSFSSSIILLVLVSFFVIQSGILEGTVQRMDGFIASLTGEGTIDSSTLLRMKYRVLGFSQLENTPLLGIGMGNARILAYQTSGHDCYLHCNYAELAANGGIIGLILFYWIYIKILVNEFKNIRINKYSMLIFLIIVLQLIMDWGAVSYYSKSTYFILMVAMLHLQKLKRQYTLYA